MSVAITKSEISLLRELRTQARGSAGDILINTLDALLARAEADDGPTLAELPENWRTLVASLNNDPRHGSRSYERGFADAVAGCAGDLENALKRERV